jgi:hypothetical protein
MADTTVADASLPAEAPAAAGGESTDTLADQAPD